ncbi:hypothetical protein FDECE_11933 [Fusarium decemcellulare]|nr:hypothetical protein FDECE_11933 [Fusarium decemcellulare]
MAGWKMKGPSHFCEWVVGTTIESALGPIPKKPPAEEKPRKRDVVRVEVTTDDESEEDTVKITYPRTGRNIPAPEKIETVVKKVRFEDAPKKSALKKPCTPAESSDETSDSGPEPASDSSQSDNASSSNASDSDAESSDDPPKPTKTKKKKKRQQQQKGIPEDADSDWDSDPDPTCKCRRCTKGREILRRIGKKISKDSIAPSPETSESETDEAPKTEKQEPGKKKKKGGKKTKEPEPEPESEAETSDSAKDTSESEPETPPKKKGSKKADKKKNNKKSEESTTEAETSESEPEPPKAKKQQPAKSKQKEAKKTQEPDTDENTDGEVSDSAKETDAEEESEPEPKKKQQQKAKPKAESPKNGNKKQQGKQEQKGNKQNKKGKQKAEKEPEKEPEEPEEPEEKADDAETGESSGEQNKGKSSKGKGKGRAEPQDAAPKKSKYKDGIKKGNYPEGLPFPHPRRPHLVEPIRAEVIQTERVIETPEDPAPNAYYDPEHNVVRVYYGPVYGNHHSHALYPDRNAFSRPLPIGTPHPTQNPCYYGFNHPQQYPAYGPNPPYHQHYSAIPPAEGYAHVPITQGMPGGPWRAVSGPPGVPPGPLANGHEAKTSPGAFEKTENPVPPSSKGKDKVGQNNVGPPSATVQDNPYLPKRNRSQFSTYGSRGARTASKGDDHPTGSFRAGSNNWNTEGAQDWNDRAGNGSQQNNKTDWTPVPDNERNGNNWEQQDQNADWNNNDNNNANWGEQTQNNDWDAAYNGQQDQDNANNWSSGSHKSNETVKKRSGDHWGNDTHLGGNYAWEEKKDVASTQGQGGDNNVVGWDVNGGDNISPDSRNGEEAPPEASVDNVMPGSWVDTPTVPSWGDPTAAADTQGEAVNW